MRSSVFWIKSTKNSKLLWDKNRSNNWESKVSKVVDHEISKLQDPLYSDVLKIKEDYIRTVRLAGVKSREITELFASLPATLAMLSEKVAQIKYDRPKGLLTSKKSATKKGKF